MSRRWFKLWIEEWETGSIRVDMDSAERGFWADMIGCAMKSRVEGLMCRDSKGLIGYTHQELANKYSVPVELVQSTIAKRLKDGSIKLRDNNVIEIVNIFKYQSKLDKSNGDKPALRTEPISQVIQDAKSKKAAAKGVINERQTVIDQFVELGYKVITPDGEVAQSKFDLDGE